MVLHPETDKSLIERVPYGEKKIQTENVGMFHGVEKRSDLSLSRRNDRKWKSSWRQSERMGKMGEGSSDSSLASQGDEGADEIRHAARRSSRMLPLGK